MARVPAFLEASILTTVTMYTVTVKTNEVKNKKLKVRDRSLESI
jgi:hypothetical protein